MKKVLPFRLGSNSKVENVKLENLSFINWLHALIPQMDNRDEVSIVVFQLPPVPFPPVTARPHTSAEAPLSPSRGVRPTAPA